MQMSYQTVASLGEQKGMTPSICRRLFADHVLFRGSSGSGAPGEEKKSLNGTRSR